MHSLSLAIWFRFNADAGIHEIAFRVVILPRQGLKTIDAPE
jgi:hypothetical protein